VATFFTDADWAASAEFNEGQVSLAVEFTLPAGQISRFRWPWPSITPTVTPGIRLYNAAGTLLASVPFDTTTLSAWNWATPGAAINVSAGTYRATVTTNRYPALSGFFTGGGITRGGVTAVQGRFDSGDVAPTQTSTAAYLVDVDFTASGGGSTVAPDGISVPVAVGSPTVAGTLTAAPDGLSVPVTLGSPTLADGSMSVAPDGIAVPVALGAPIVGAAGVVPDGVSVPVALGSPSLTWSATVAPAGLSVPIALGTPSTITPGSIVHRPNTGTVTRPFTGIVTRP
jgi:hypothetical protein